MPKHHLAYVLLVETRYIKTCSRQFCIKMGWRLPHDTLVTERPTWWLCYAMNTSNHVLTSVLTAKSYSLCMLLSLVTLDYKIGYAAGSDHMIAQYGKRFNRSERRHTSLRRNATFTIFIMLPLTLCPLLNSRVSALSSRSRPFSRHVSSLQQETFLTQRRVVSRRLLEPPPPASVYIQRRPHGTHGRHTPPPVQNDLHGHHTHEKEIDSHHDHAGHAHSHLVMSLSESSKCCPFLSESVNVPRIILIGRNILYIYRQARYTDNADRARRKRLFDGDQGCRWMVCADFIQRIACLRDGVFFFYKE